MGVYCCGCVVGVYFCLIVFSEQREEKAVCVFNVEKGIYPFVFGCFQRGRRNAPGLCFQSRGENIVVDCRKPRKKQFHSFAKIKKNSVKQ